MPADSTTRCLNVDTHNFEHEVLDKPGPVLVDFCAQWCAPCRLLGPVLESIAARFDGQLRVARLNVDENPDLANAFKIRSIPALMLIHDGRLAGQWVGYRTERALAADLERLLARTETSA